MYFGHVLCELIIKFEDIGLSHFSELATLHDTLLPESLLACAYIGVAADVAEVVLDETTIDLIDIEVVGVDESAADVVHPLSLVLDLLGEGVLAEVAHRGVDDLLERLKGLDHVVLHSLGHRVDGVIETVLLLLHLVPVLLDDVQNVLLLLLQLLLLSSLTLGVYQPFHGLHLLLLLDLHVLSHTILLLLNYARSLYVILQLYSLLSLLNSLFRLLL